MNAAKEIRIQKTCKFGQIVATAKKILKECELKKTAAGGEELYWKGYQVVEFESSVNMYMYGNLVARLAK